MDLPYGLTMRGLLKKDEKILLLRRPLKCRTNPGCWELPGGKVDSGEFFDEALVRELKEEINLDITIGKLIGAVQEDFSHKRTVVIIMEVKSESYDVKISDEHIDWMWASLDEFKDLKLSSSLISLLEEKNYKL
ncbi:NUDIX domain-containing protein [Methanobrevibacter sp. DSM 116169]|uniref:NUDIX domain-containing protein n=1 Tax=Methanobrevibacter sp. DSM 116169 TaxID=3242727 RepID=UPI0038FC1DDF